MCAGIKSGGFPISEAVRLALETAALGEGPIEAAQQDSVTNEAATRMAAYLGAAFPATAAAWKSRHKHQLRGSARVLQCWLGRTSEAAIRDLQRCRHALLSFLLQSTRSDHLASSRPASFVTCCSHQGLLHEFVHVPVHWSIWLRRSLGELTRNDEFWEYDQVEVFLELQATIYAKTGLFCLEHQLS